MGAADYLRARSRDRERVHSNMFNAD